MSSSLRVAVVCNYLLLFIEFSSFVSGVTRMSFKSIQSRHSSRYFSNFSIEIINGSIYNEFYLRRRLDPGYRCRLEYQLRIANAKQFQPLFHFDIDVCATIIALKDHMLKDLYRSLLKYSNFMTNCPFYPDHYYLKGWQIESALIPKYVYPGDYKIVANAYLGKFKKRTMDFIVEIELQTKIE